MSRKKTIEQLRNNNEQLNNKVDELTNAINTAKKTYTPRIYWNKEGKKIPLFNFNSSEQIRLAVQIVPELAATLSYLGTAFSSGEFKEIINGEEQDESKIIDLLNNPHSLYKGTYLKRIIIEYLMAFGVCYLYMNNNGLRDNTENISILPYNTLPFVGDANVNDYLLSSDDIIKKFKFNWAGVEYYIDDPSKVVSITWNTEISIENQYLIYQSPLKPLESALMVTPAMYDTMQNLMNNFGMRGFISNKTTDSGGYYPLQPDEEEVVAKKFKKFGLREGQQQFDFVNYNLEFTPVSSPIRNMLLPQQQKMIKTIISDVLNFDTVLLNNDSANKYANYVTARKSMFTENLIPTGNNISEELSSYFYKFKKNQEIKIDFNHIDVFTEDEKDKAEAIKKVSEYVISLNEAVKAENMSRETAISTLTINGYSEEEAESLISIPTNSNEL